MKFSLHRNIRYLIVLVYLFTGTGYLYAQKTVYPASFTVAQDGSGNFKTIQEAVNAVRDLSQQRVTIHIKKGIYHEKIVVPSWKTKILLLGDSRDSTIITNADFSGKPVPGGSDAFGRDKFSTYTSYTVLVQGNDFKAENLTIVNAAGRVGQAVALHVEADRCAFINCHLVGNQDTLYAANETSRQYYQRCEIEGTTDFIFGEATAVFDDCTLRCLSESFITAASTTPRQAYGYVFMHCCVVGEPAVKKEKLGRPWRPNAKVAFLDCDLGNHIVPEGWHNWDNPENEKTVFYAEYQSKNSGDLNARLAWTRQLTTAEAKKYTLPAILGGKDNWNPLNEKL